MYVNFEIERIFAGWFDIALRSDEFKIELSASDAWEKDSPKNVLKILCDLIMNENIHRYVIWDEEPGIYIICISKINQKCKLNIVYSEKDHDELLKDVSEVTGILSYDELQCKFGALEELLSVDDLCLDYFVKTVARSFQEYSKGEHREQYEENWMEFPKEELKKLEQLLKF